MMGAISSGLGLLKGMGQEKQWERQRQVEALKTAYAPILGTMGDMGQRPDKFQSALDFGVKGMSLGMAMDKHNKAMAEGKPSGDANAKSGSAVKSAKDAAITGDSSLVFSPGNISGIQDFALNTPQSLSPLSVKPEVAPDVLQQLPSFSGMYFGEPVKTTTTLYGSQLPQVQGGATQRPVFGFGSGRGW